MIDVRPAESTIESNVLGHDDCLEEASSVSDVVRLIVPSQLSNVVEECLRLLLVGQVQLGRQIHDLQLDNVLLIWKRFGELPEDVWCNLGDVPGVFA